MCALCRCSLILIVPYISAMKGALVAGNATVGDVIKAGFLVRSKANIGWCGECQAAGGNNRYDGGVSDDHTCFCSSGQASGSCPTTSSGSGTLD